jgi:hypothetical protein
MAFSRLYKRIVTGDGMRRTRLHTQSGDLVDASAFVFAPQWVWSTLLLKVGYRQPIPWLGFRVTRHLGKLLRPDWKVLEFGSGMSSLLFASRCRHLVSIESEPAWYERMRTHFAQKGFTNVDYRLRAPGDYARLDDLPDGSFDFALVDGIKRDEAVVTAIRKCRSGGWMMMDNTDVPWTDHQAARAALIAAAVPGSITVYRDLTPFGFQVCESTFIRKA